MSKLAGHLLQTAPFVLAASLMTPQGASAAPPAAVDPLETTETATIETTNWQAPAPPEPNPELDLREPPVPVAVPEPVAFEPVLAPEPVVIPEPVAIAEPVTAPEPVAIPEVAPEPAALPELEEIATAEPEMITATPAALEPMALPTVAGDPLTVTEPVVLPEAAAPLEITTTTAGASPILAPAQEVAPAEIDGDSLTESVLIPLAESSEGRSPTAADLTPEIAGDPLPSPEPEAQPIPLEPVAATSTPQLMVNPMALDQFAAEVEGPRGAIPMAQTFSRDLEELETGSEAIAQTNVHELLDQINQYTNESNPNLGQGVSSASQFRDVIPTDWAYTALDDLVRRYDCIRGYPDGTFRGNRDLTRYEFAAGLNACVQQIERIIAETTATLASRADLEILQRLVQEFEGELATISTRVDALDGRVAILEDQQFSTTTKLDGEAIFAINALLPQSYTRTTGAPTIENDVVFQDRVRLNLDTSFTGRDRLRTRLQAGNVTSWPGINSITNEARYGFATDNNNDIQIDDLAYRFPFGDEDKGMAQIFAHGAGMDELLMPLNPLNSSGGGSISRFGQYNPILRVGGQRQGFGASYKVTDELELAVGYTAGEGQNPSLGGLFNGSYALGGQVKYTTDNLGVAIQYINSYNPRGGLNHNTGSIASNLMISGASVTANNFGAEVLFRPRENLFVGGWGGLTDGKVANLGRTDIWNYALVLGVEDIGGEGNLLGFVVGQQPRLTSSPLATVDPNVGYHIEGFYRFAVSDRIEITPGVIWLPDPGHTKTNKDIFAATIRTRFRF
ncbi:iron uptake porin [Spirulina sp. CCNP1310]|uniref:iron uptake porin n=1 Tax=Spirulina sp. CCNP1310 TaxID=3110249 RepID=UPI002B204D11|nr:iron uptake porin [Spirulina sp. CCNP1310]MEA5419302.1 iron uptake porin [Spirulina sp. CCNP1310]